MKNYRMKFLGVASLALLTFGLVSPSQADTCAVRVVFTKGGFIVGVGGGRGVMVCKGKRYPFSVSGMSVGFTIGASTSQFSGHALNVRSPSDIEGSYAALGASGAVAAGAGGVQLQNGKGVILQLAGPKVGVELSAAVAGVTVRLE
jgi:hypothetical protein